MVLVDTAEPNAVNTKHVSVIKEESNFKINARPLPSQEYSVDWHTVEAYNWFFGKTDSGNNSF